MQNLYTFTVPVFVKSLTAMKAFIAKGVAEAVAAGADQATLPHERIAPDMLPLAKQVQIACDTAKAAGARLAGVEAPKYEDNETTFEELYARIDKTVAFLSTLTAEQFSGAEEKLITMPYVPEGKGMKGLEYVRAYALPNFFFHVTTAYNILRLKGASMGKGDFIGGWPELHDLPVA